MAKHDDKPHHKSEGVKLVGSPAALIDLLIKDADLNQWATEHIVNEGPKHKQVLTALLLRRLYALVRSIEKSTDTEFVLQEGYGLTKEKGTKEDVLPVSLPIHLGWAGMRISWLKLCQKRRNMKSWPMPWVYRSSNGR